MEYIISYRDKYDDRSWFLFTGTKEEAEEQKKYIEQSGYTEVSILEANYE